MGIDEIIEQHRVAILSKNKDKKYKSFGHIFWEDFSKTREDLEAMRAITFLFPAIAAIAMLVVSLILCGSCCSDNCCSECLICIAAAAETDPVCLLSMLFMLVTFPIHFASNSNTTRIIADTVTAVLNLIVLEIYGRNTIVTCTAFIIYIIFIYLMFKRPFIKWYKLNK